MKHPNVSQETTIADHKGKPGMTRRPQKSTFIHHSKYNQVKDPWLLLRVTASKTTKYMIVGSAYLNALKKLKWCRGPQNSEKNRDVTTDTATSK